MNKYFVKNRLLITSIFSIIFSLFLVSCFFIPSILKCVQSNSRTSIYKKTEIDYIIPSPSKQQVEELKQFTHIGGVLPYYFTSTKAESASKTLGEQKIFLFDSLDALELSQYNTLRCIKSVDNALENEAYIDYISSQALKINCNDKISLYIAGQKIDFIIAQIFESDDFTTNGSIAIEFSGQAKKAIESKLSKPLDYSGAYIKSNNLTESNSYFMTEYKPMALLKSRDEFDTDEAYKIHYDGFYSVNYSKQIRNIDNDSIIAESQSKTDDAMSMVLLVFLCLSVIIGLIVFNLAIVLNQSNKKFMRSFIIKGGIKSQIAILNGKEILLQFVAFLVLFTGFSLIGFQFINQYFTFKMIAHIIVASSLALLFGLILSAFLIKIFTDKENIKNEKERLKILKERVKILEEKLKLKTITAEEKENLLKLRQKINE